VKRYALIMAIFLLVNVLIIPVSAAPVSWAADEVKQAENLGLVPADLQNEYQNYCTREEFCRLAVAIIEAHMGKTVSRIFFERGIESASGIFIDTQNGDIEAAYTLGIVKGVGDNKFLPDGRITREQAAVMLMRASNVLGYTPTGIVLSFADRNEFSYYAVQGIDFVAKSGVMNGVSNNRFDPKGYYTREMAYVTMLRLYNAINNDGKEIVQTNAGSSQSESKVLTAEEIFKKCSPSIFPITVYDTNGNKFGSGSGFFIESNGVLVTNYHVIEDAYSADIKLDDGTVVKVGKVLGYNIQKDLAILKAEVSGVDVLKIGDSSNISSGQKVYAIGSPLGLQNSISDGIVSNPYREEVGGIQITAAISAGSSGGALLNEYGEVIGVTFGAIEAGQNLNFAIPISEVGKISRNAGKTFAQVVAENAAEEYNNRSEIFDEVYAESEPNDTSSEANIIENGYSILGSITSKAMDVYQVQCKSKGTVRLYLKATSRFASDLVFAISPKGKTDEKDIVFAKGGYSNGAYYMTIEYPVEQAGYYNIYVMSAKLAFIANVNIEYLFYYEFKPA